MEQTERLPIGQNEVRKAEADLQIYKKWKEPLNDRLIENEKWWEFKQWEIIRGGKDKGKDPEPKSGWLFNSIINKHADFMDNFPAPNILPREESDKDTAKMLSSVVECILEQNEYEDLYNDASWDKIKSGPGVYAVLWDPYKDNIGDIIIKNVDILNLYWEPGVEDIQKSANLFYQSLVEKAAIETMYPQMKGKTGNDGSEIARYQYGDEEIIQDKAVVTDWYYKKTVTEQDQNGIKYQKNVVHFAKICNGELLYATENDPEKQNGIYEHGLYPFIFDVLFPVKGSPAGMGYIDIMKDAQMYIDKMQQSILKNTIAGSKPRYFCRDGSGINETEFADLTKDIVHYNGPIDGIKELIHYPLDATYLNVMINKVDELKETSGNRDFSQGATTSGVTAASAIAALQEAGSKLSRDMIKTSYRACRDITFMVIELMRQFYTIPRVFRITGDRGSMQFVQFDNSALRPEETRTDFEVLTGGRKPYFDIKISAQKASPFTKISQNELAKELYNLGFFNPQFADQALMCLSMMYFDGKDEIERKISENGTMYQQLIAMQNQMAQMADVIAKSTGDTRLVDAVAQTGVNQAVPSGETKEKNVDDFGNVAKEGMNSTAGKARAKAAAAATPKV